MPESFCYRLTMGNPLKAFIKVRIQLGLAGGQETGRCVKTMQMFPKLQGGSVTKGDS